MRFQTQLLLQSASPENPSNYLAASIAVARMGNIPKAMEHIQDFLVHYGYEHYKIGASFEDAINKTTPRVSLQNIMLEAQSFVLHSTKDLISAQLNIIDEADVGDGLAMLMKKAQASVEMLKIAQISQTLNRDFGYMHLNLKNYEEANSFFKEYKEYKEDTDLQITEEDEAAMAYSILQRKQEVKKAKKRRQNANKRAKRLQKERGGNTRAG